MNPYGPIKNRKYTITHSDVTAELFVFVSSMYAEDQIKSMRDEVRVSWELDHTGLRLAGSVLLDGEGVAGETYIRNNIFYNEMPKALQALRQADRFFFEKTPSLDDAKVYIHFISSDPMYDQTYDYGMIGFYQ